MLVFNYTKTLVGCIHEKKFKLWNMKLVAEIIMSYTRSGGEVREMEDKMIQFADL